MVRISIIKGSNYMIIISLSVLGLLISLVTIVNNDDILSGVLVIYLLLSNIIILLWGISRWLHELRGESVIGEDTPEEGNNLWIGIVIIIVSEVTIIACYIWAYIYNLLDPDTSVVMWPPVNISISGIEVVIINTLVLLTTGVTVTIAMTYMESANKVSILTWLALTVLLGIVIVAIQLVEYSYREYTITDSIYGTIIINITGLHGIHVIVGLCLLINSIIRVSNDEYKVERKEGLDMSILYWHMVDAVWLVVLIIIYVIGDNVVYNDIIEPYSYYYQDYASIGAALIYEVSSIIWIYLIIVLNIVLWWLIWSCVRSMHSVSEVRSIEVLWTIVPSIIIGLIMLPSINQIYLSNDQDSACITVKVIGNQWIWEWETLSESVVSMPSTRFYEVDNPIIVPVDTPIRIIVTSNDVMHSISVPSLGIKIDCIPGRLNEVTTNIVRAGTYYGSCTELCGVGHSNMPISVKSVVNH